LTKNWEDLTNVWITISPQTGLVTANDVADTGYAANTLPDSKKWWEWLWRSRYYARQSQGMGGL